MKEVYIGIFNMGVAVTCDDPYIGVRRCICPDKDSFEYLCYLCSKELKNKPFITSYILQINQKNGEVSISPEVKGIAYCKYRENEMANIVKMEVNKPQNRLKKFRTWKMEDKIAIIYLVNLLQTKEVLRYQNDVNMQHMISVWDAGMLFENFWNLVHVWMENVESGTDCKEIFATIVTFWEKINEIYNARAEVFSQYEVYINETVRGLKKEKIDIDDATVYYRSTEMRDQVKEQCLRDFLFLEKNGMRHANEEDFYELLSLIKAFLESYSVELQLEEQSKIFLRSLEGFMREEIPLEKIQGLGSLKLEGKTTLKTDATVILQYLRRGYRSKQILNYERIGA